MSVTSGDGVHGMWELLTGVPQQCHSTMSWSSDKTMEVAEGRQRDGGFVKENPAGNGKEGLKTELLCRRLTELGLFSLEKNDDCETVVIIVFKYVKDRHKERGDELFSVSTGDKARITELNCSGGG